MTAEEPPLARQTERDVRPNQAPPLEARVERAYEEHFSTLSRYARMLSHGDDAMAEDLVHAVFVSLIRADREGTWPEDVRAYLFGALIRHDRSRRRDAARRDAAFWESYGRMLRTNAHAATSLEENLDDLVRAMQRLPEEQREIMLRLQAGLSFRETAEALGIPEKTARSRYYNALEKLREMLR